MLLTCDNKGCLSQTAAELDVETLEVICLECEKPINSIAEPMKRVLKSYGQIVRHQSKQAFTIACMSCYANREVVIDGKGDTVCAICKKHITVHAAMKLAMEATNTKLRKLTVEEETVKQKESVGTVEEVKPKKNTRRKKKTASKK